MSILGGPYIELSFGFGAKSIGNSVPFFPFYLGVSLLKLTSGKKGTLIG